MPPLYVHRLFWVANLEFFIVILLIYFFVLIAVYDWMRLDKNDYYFDELCGVEILPNCKSPNCQALCESHHDCNQVAELSNICINIKNTSESDDCIVKLTPNLELYRKGWNCWNVGNLQNSIFMHRIIFSRRGSVDESLKVF